MSIFKFSEKLNLFLQKIESETGRQIKFMESSNLGIKGITAAFQYHPHYILIILDPEYPRQSSDIERSIAHEATHGYILYKLGFCRTQFNPDVSDEYKRDVQLVLTMVEDVVVNKIISLNGFPPYGTEYLPMVREEINIAHGGEEAGEEFYHEFAAAPHLEALLMISRYIIAWGFLKYYDLKDDDGNLIKEFTNTFKRFYPDYYQFAREIEKIMDEKDIFIGKGECEAVRDILRLFNMDQGVKLVKN